MCRLLAYASEEPTAAADVLGASGYAAFRRLSRLHRDGWGMAWLAGHRADPGALGAQHEGALAARRSLVPACDDPDFDELARSALGSAGLVHLRWATAGYDVSPGNTHPFLAGGWAFVHQGSIPDPERLEALLTPEWSGRLRGTTDSERYFLYLLQCATESGDVVTGARRAVGDIVRLCGPTSLNAMLLSTSSLVVVHGTAGLEAPLADMVDVVGSDGVPAEHVDGYFRLRYRCRETDVAVVSSGLGGEGGWTELPGECVLAIDLSDRAVSFHPFD